jgi:uncharacterized membrane protein
MIRTIFYCFLYAVLNVSGAAVFKWKLKGHHLTEFNHWITFLLDLKIIGAFCLVFLSALVMFKALSLGQLTFVVPVSTGINFILTIIVGYFIFKDHITVASFTGFALILTGIILLSFNNLNSGT